MHIIQCDFLEEHPEDFGRYITLETRYIPFTGNREEAETYIQGLAQNANKGWCFQVFETLTDPSSVSWDAVPFDYD